MSAPSAPSLRANLRALPRGAWILYAGTFINRFGSFVAPFIVLYLQRRGYSPAESGMAVAAYGVGSIGASPVGGLMADRLGRRTTMALSMGTAAVAMMALSQAVGLVAIVALTAAVGFTSELYRPAAGALLADLVPEEHRVAAFATYRLAINAGFAIGPALAGLIAERSFFWLFVGDAATSAIFGVVALVALPEGHRTRRGDETAGEGFRTVLSDRGFLLFLVATVLGAFVYMQSFTTFPLHVRANGMSASVYGLLISLNGALIVFLELPIASVTQRLPAKPVMAVGTLLSGLGFALTWSAHAALGLAGTVLIWTLGEMIVSPVAAAYVAGLAPPHLRGRYQGVWTLSFGLSLVIAPAGGTALFAWRPGALWLLCGILAAVSAGLLMLGPKVRPTAVGAPEPGPELPGIET